MEAYPWSLLEIAPTNDERAIRRAYSILLKRNRPDEAPDAFQALITARDLALKLAQEKTYEADEPESGEPEPDAAKPEPAQFAVASIEMLFADLAARRGAEPASSGPEPDRAGARTASGFNSVSRSDLKDIMMLLDGLGLQGAAIPLKVRWSQIFDRAEMAPLELHETIMAQIVYRLVADLRRHVGDLPEPGLFVAKGDDLFTSSSLKDYDVILADFERRFRILNEDRVLQRYLSDSDAFYLTDALSQATGRQSAFSARILSPEANRLNAVPLIDPDFVNMAFGEDQNIRDFYQRCRVRGTYEVQFSWTALIFPFAWALYYRLTGLAWMFGTLIASMTSIAVIHHFGVTTQLDDIVPAVYMAVTLACAFQSGRLRIQDFARSVLRIQAKAGSHQVHVAAAARAATPSPSAAILGMLFLAACLYIAVLYGLVLDVVPL